MIRLNIEFIDFFAFCADYCSHICLNKHYNIYLLNIQKLKQS